MEHRSVIERWKGMYQQQVGDDHKAETTSQLALEEQAFHLHLIRQRTSQKLFKQRGRLGKLPLR